MTGTSSSNPKRHVNDKVYGITNIKSYVPLLLNLDRLNYDSWKELFKTHCIGYSVYNHLDGSSPEADETNLSKVDNIVKQWLYGTLTQSVLHSIITSDASAAQVWNVIENLFHENKESKAMELDDELHTISIGDSSIIDCYARIKSISDLLISIGFPVPKRNLAIYALNGLSQKYSCIATTIRPQKPFPYFIDMQSMLTLEERSINKEHIYNIQASHSDNPSSPTMLNVEHHNRQSNSSGGDTQTGGRGGGQNHHGGRGGCKQMRWLWQVWRYWTFSFRWRLGRSVFLANKLRTSTWATSFASFNDPMA
ncbi:hypothetical protein Lser_V15G14136 [Lactuca serriola]